MAQPKPCMNVYLLSHAALHTEWLSLMGDKYRHLPEFEWQIVPTPEQADVFVWDGIISPKGRTSLKPILEYLHGNKVLLLQGEGQTLMSDHPYMKLVNLTNLKYVQLPGWSVLPEAIIEALKQCYQKLGHV
jgi:Ni,Fe-hydrogenase III small subunit